MIEQDSRRAILREMLRGGHEVDSPTLVLLGLYDAAVSLAEQGILDRPDDRDCFIAGRKYSLLTALLPRAERERLMAEGRRDP